MDENWKRLNQGSGLCPWKSGAGTQWLADRETKAVAQPRRKACSSLQLCTGTCRLAANRPVVGLLRKKWEGSRGVGL